MSNITPPPELVEQWRTAPEYTTGMEMLTMVSMTTRRLQEIADQAARWGADQELEACCEWASQFNYDDYRYQDELRALRRPKPPSLKEQALDELYISFDRGYLKEGAADIIRRALEQLDD